MNRFSLLKKSNTITTSENAVSLKEAVYDLEVAGQVYEVVQPKASVIRLYSPLQKNSNLFFKRAIDLIVSSFLIIFFLSWVIPIIALLIKMETRGPIFFYQKRNKRNGKIFTCIKFRTMVINSEADTLAACENDGRITKLGNFFRKNHLDELPQLLNVWWGDMSLIGPRPYMISDNIKYEKIIYHYSLRNEVKPGITGLAQSMGHFGFLLNVKTMHERTDLDIKYIKNWSLKMDIKIIYRTLRMVLKL